MNDFLEWDRLAYDNRKKTRNERKRSRARITVILPVFALTAVLAVFSAACEEFPASEGKDTTQEENAVEAPQNAKSAGRIPGDNIPATERCFMTDEEIQEDFENAKIEAALLNQAHIIEGCVITFYCAEKRPHICGTGNGIAFDGTPVLPWATCAVDPDVIPLGSTVMVDLGDGEGLRYFVANDTAVKGKHVDLCVATHDEALSLGTKTATVYWCEEGRK